MCTKEKALCILNEVFDSCNPLLNSKIKDAYLYGSYARGDFHNESDVDILLTVDMTAQDISKYRKYIAGVTSGLSLKHDVTVSVAVKPIEQFLKYSEVLPYYKNVIKDGIRYGV